ncbi:hypothetical protein MMC22_008917 [Lobaria immixta]|nr:hypothetical protein [Lobaria immixta]
MPSPANSSVSSAKSALSATSSSPPMSLSPSQRHSKSKPKQPLSHSHQASPVSLPEADLKSRSPLILNSKPRSGQSSSALQKALAAFRAHHAGHRLGEWTRYSLCLEQSEGLFQSLADDRELEAYVNDKVRYYYVPHATELVIRMPSPVRERFTALVVQEIKRQIDIAIVEFSKDTSLSPSAQVLRNIEWTASSDIVAHDNPSHKRSPDASFHCNGVHFPSLVVETAYSQGAKSLRRVADDLVMMSNGDVKMVIGLELGYRSKKTTKVTDKVFVWEPKWKAEKVPVLTSECTFNKPFRNVDGHLPVTGSEALIIPLCALAPRAILDKYGIVNNQYLLPAASISMTTLATFLDQAQEEDLREEDARREMRRKAMTDLKIERDGEDWEP